MSQSTHLLLASALVFAAPAAATIPHCDGSDTPGQQRVDVDKEGPSPIVIYVLEAKGPS
jgi:hypothetical protein